LTVIVDFIRDAEKGCEFAGRYQYGSGEKNFIRWWVVYIGSNLKPALSASWIIHTSGV